MAGPLCIAFGGQAMGQIASSIEAFAKARQAIKPGIDVIKRVPKMDIYSTDGAQPSQVMLTLLRVISK